MQFSFSVGMWADTLTATLLYGRFSTSLNGMAGVQSGDIFHSAFVYWNLYNDKIIFSTHIIITMFINWMPWWLCLLQNAIINMFTIECESHLRPTQDFLKNPKMVGMVECPRQYHCFNANQDKIIERMCQILTHGGWLWYEWRGCRYGNFYHAWKSCLDLHNGGWGTYPRWTRLETGIKHLTKFAHKWPPAMIWKPMDWHPSEISPM